MYIDIPGGWMLFCVAAGMMLLLSFVLIKIEERFITRDVLYKTFNMMDLQLAAKELEIDNLLRGINKMDGERTDRVFRSLRSYLWVDYLFIPAAYGTLFIACMQIAGNMPLAGRLFFSALAWLQLVAMVCDGIENGYLLRKVDQHHQLGLNFRPGYKQGGGFFSVFQYIVGIKWVTSLLGAVCVLSSLLYFWLSGLFGVHLLKWMLVFLGEVLGFLVMCRVFKKKGEMQGVGPSPVQGRNG